MLRGLADTLQKDGARGEAVVRKRLAEQVGQLLGPAGETLIAQVWRDALGDLSAHHVPAAPQPVPVPAPKADRPAREPREARVGKALRQRVDELEAEAVVLRTAVAEQKRWIEVHEGALVEIRQAVESLRKPPAPPTPVEGITEQFRRRVMADGRSWWDLTVEVAAEHGVSPFEVTSDSRIAPIPMARFHVWSAIFRCGLGYSLSYIGNAWGVDHTTVMAGIRVWERTKKPAPPSGPRLTSVAPIVPELQEAG